MSVGAGGAPGAEGALLPRERSTLAALVDTLLPPVPATGAGSPWPSGRALGVDAEISELVAQEFSPTQRAEFRRLLATVDSPLLNLILGGRPVRFSALDARAREEYLFRWAASRLGVKRRGFQAIKRLALFLYYGRERPDRDSIRSAIGVRPTVVVAPAPPSRHRPVAVTGPVDIACDAVVVGSGAGGAAIAARLARSGHSVVVLEAGPWREGATFPREEVDAYSRLFHARGLLTTRDLSVTILAGATAGGSTTVNWMTCLEPPAPVRAEWAAAGLTQATGAGFSALLAEAAARIHVTDSESSVNPPNDVLRRGCLALNYVPGTDFDVIRRNADGCEGRCGVCVFGCPWDAKRSALVTFLADALSSGARLYSQTRVQSIEVSGGRATGVRAVFRDGRTEHPVRVRARAVVVAGGAVQTPALLQASGAGPSGVGHGLRLHPTTAVFAEYPEPMRMWEGPMQTIFVRRFTATDPALHGPWIESVPAHPGLAASALPWTSAADHRDRMLRIERAAASIVLVRDVGEGRVRADATGRPLLEYRLTTADRDHLLQGMVETARIHRAAGALRIATLHAGGLSAGDGRRPVTASEFDAFESEVWRRGVRENDVALFSAHPTGSARIGTDPARSACRPTGEVHGVNGLWVGDGSLLPSAPGVNPMLSIYAVALGTAGHIDAALRR